MKLLNITILSGILIIGLTGCVASPESDPAYVSPTQYSNYNCKQISAEMQRVSTKLEQMSTGTTDATGQVLGTALAAFAISQGYNVGGGDDSAYRRLYNQYEVLEQTSIQKECY